MAMYSIRSERAFCERLNYDLNSLIKRRFESPTQRAPAVGASRQHFALLGTGLYINLRAEIAYGDRLVREAA